MISSVGDGIEYIDRARAAVIADNLIADQRMRPVILVFTAPVDRTKELLERKGYQLAYKELNAGHNWTHWADALADALSYMFPASNKK